MADHIRLNDVALFAHLGVSDAEREVGQRIHIDIDLTVDMTQVAASDALADTVNYEAVYQAAVQLVDHTRHRLLETLAGDLIDKLLGAFPVSEVRVRIRKPNVPFAGSLSSAEIEMVRSR